MFYSFALHCAQLNVISNFQSHYFVSHHVFQVKFLLLVTSVNLYAPCCSYCTSEEFAADAQLVFNNCELFNEDTSEVGMAGHSMRRFFERRWAEFFSNSEK